MKDKSRLILCSTICVAIICGLLSFICGCTKPVSTPETPAKPTPAPIQSPEKPIKLIYATFTPPGDATTLTVEKWAQDLMDRSGGKVEVEVSVGGSLAPIPELYNALIDGVTDMVFFLPYITPGRFPVSEGFTLPIRSTAPTGETLTKAMIDMIKKGYLDNEFSDVIYLWGNNPDPCQFFWRDKPATRLEDFKGKKLRYVGGPSLQVVESLGAIPVSIPGNEFYSAMEKGTVDGGLVGFSSAEAFKWYEVTKYITEVNLFGVGFASAMNKKSYDNLPKDIQAIVDDMIANMDEYALFAARLFDEQGEKGRGTAAQDGIIIESLAPGEMDKLDPLFAPVWTKWIADAKEKGVPTEKFLSDLYSSLKGLGVDKPFIGYTPIN